MINVKSEYGKLKKVLVHRPGEETANLTPSTYEALLFEDAYFLPQAQREHDAFVHVLKQAGVEVVYIEDLVAETFDIVPESKVEFLKKFIKEAGIQEGTDLEKRVTEYTKKFKNNKALVVKLIEGVRYDELSKADEKKFSLSEFVIDDLWAFEPMPNLVFQRDPFASIGNGISLHYMANNTRRRETLFAATVFKYHPDYKNTPKYYDRDNNNGHSLEGGDVMILSDKEIAVGISERTSPEGIEDLAKNIFADSSSTIKTIYGINIPKGRAWMHLDTVFTQIDIDKFSIFSNHPFEIYKIEGNSDKLKITKITKTIDEFLKGIFKTKKVTLIQAGGGDPLFSERDQWNDGANVLSIAPNEIIVYDRNSVTNSALRKAGVIVHEIPSYELSRGRGGPRCMSMPLVREDIK